MKILTRIWRGTLKLSEVFVLACGFMFLLIVTMDFVAGMSDVPPLVWEYFKLETTTFTAFLAGAFAVSALTSVVGPPRRNWLHGVTGLAASAYLCVRVESRLAEHIFDQSGILRPVNAEDVMFAVALMAIIVGATVGRNLARHEELVRIGL